MTRPKTLFTIPAHRPFLETLVMGLRERTHNDPAALAQWEIYLPNIRACERLRALLVAESPGQCTLLPKIRPIKTIGSEFASDKALLPTYRRQMLLAHCLRKLLPPHTPLGQLLGTAKKLANLIDQAYAHYVDWEKLNTLVPEELAGHWKLSTQFLDIITDFWPQIVAEHNAIEPEFLYRQQIDRLGTYWRTATNLPPLVVAGTTASLPTTARLLTHVLGRPQGHVVLPGLDIKDLKEGPLKDTLPWYNMANFARTIDPVALENWHDRDDAIPGRKRLFQEAFVPTESPLPPDATQGLWRLDAPTQQTEALCIALLLRQTLEDPHRRAALVTPDKRLAQKVKAYLKRWGIAIEDSADDVLSQTPVGSFLLALLSVASPTLSPETFLSFLHHPLTRVIDGEQDRAQAHFLNHHWFRDLIAPATLQDLRHRAQASQNPALVSWVNTLCTKLEPLENLTPESFAALAQEWVPDLWEREGGKQCQEFLESLQSFNPFGFKETMVHLLDAVDYRSVTNTHPRLFIWGLLEARLQSVDTVILGSLNEGLWPPEEDPCPWLNDALRGRLGLPQSGRRVGLSAHDFMQGFFNKNVYMTRSLVANNIPTIPCRWLVQLDLACRRAGLELPQAQDLLALAQTLESTQTLTPCPRPAPIPPLAARPKRLSITDLAQWIHNPYGTYGKRILKLAPLDPLKADFDYRKFGIFTHRIIEKVTKDNQISHWPHFQRAAQQVYGEQAPCPLIQHFWQPKTEALGRWFCAHQALRDGEVLKRHGEVKGRLTFKQTYTLTGVADCIEERVKGYRLIDYKTGAIPTKGDVLNGRAPQLPLEMAMARYGVFEGLIHQKPIEALEHWQLKAQEEYFKINTIALESDALAEQAYVWAQDVFDYLNAATTPFEATLLGRPGDPLAHLSRENEWSRQRKIP